MPYIDKVNSVDRKILFRFFPVFVKTSYQFFFIASIVDVAYHVTDSEGEPDETDPLAPKPITPRPTIPVDSLWNFIRQGKSNNSQKFKQEYDVSA